MANSLRLKSSLYNVKNIVAGCQSLYTNNINAIILKKELTTDNNRCTMIIIKDIGGRGSEKG